MVNPDTNNSNPYRQSGKSGSRAQSSRFLLHDDSPLHKSHCLMLQSKNKLVIMANGKPPLYPFTDKMETDAQRKSKDKFA